MDSGLAASRRSGMTNGRSGARGNTRSKNQGMQQNRCERFLRLRVEFHGRPYNEGVRSCLRAAAALRRFFSSGFLQLRSALTHSRSRAGLERAHRLRQWPVRRHRRPRWRALPHPRWRALPRPRWSTLRRPPWPVLRRPRSRRVRRHILPHPRARLPPMWQRHAPASSGPRRRRQHSGQRSLRDRGRARLP
jgi:hypothetical protein